MRLNPIGKAVIVAIVVFIITIATGTSARADSSVTIHNDTAENVEIVLERGGYGDTLDHF